MCFYFLCLSSRLSLSLFFFFNDTATTEIYTLSLHDALPISGHDLLDVPEGYSSLLSNDSRVLRNSLRVARCIRIASFNVLYHQLQQIPVRLFELHIHLVDVSHHKKREYERDHAEQFVTDVEIREERRDGCSEQVIKHMSAVHSRPNLREVQSLRQSYRITNA